MDALESEAEEATNKFIKSQCFKNIESFVQYTNSLKLMHIDDACQQCTAQNVPKLYSIINSGCVILKPALSPPINNGGSSTVDIQRKSERKSRRSVCVQKLNYSFSDSDDNNDNDDDTGSEDEVFINKRHLQESSNSDSKFEEKEDECGEGSDTSPLVRKKKNIRTISSGSDSNKEEDGNHREQINIAESESESESAEDREETDGTSSENEATDKKDGTSSGNEAIDKKDGISSENDDNIDNSDGTSTENEDGIKNKSISSENEEVGSRGAEKKGHTLQKDMHDDSSSDEDNDYNKFLSNCKETKPKKYNKYHANVGISSSDDTDDFTTPLHTKVTNVKTPKTVFTPKTPKTVFKTPKAVFKTPRSSLGNIIDKFPSSEPRTPKYKHHFNKKKDEMIKEMYSLYNRTVFDNRLPPDFQISWNKRMTKTAGFCYLQTASNTRKSRIELSTKVVDTVERLRDTLIHELCHAATWIFEGKRGHGLAWKYWAIKANKVHPELPIIETCHSYTIETKYKYQCERCSTVFGRHTKSIDETKHACGKCGGRPLLLSVSGSSVSETPKRVNAYSEYVKKHFSRIKGENPECSSRDVMKKVAEDFRAFKISESEDKENVLDFN